MSPILMVPLHCISKDFPQKTRNIGGLNQVTSNLSGCLDNVLKPYVSNGNVQNPDMTFHYTDWFMTGSLYWLFTIPTNYN